MIHPLAFTMLYSIILATLFDQDFRDYSIYVFSGIVLWEALASFMNLGAHSIINASGYIKQSPIPLLLFPLRTCITITFVLILSFLSFAVYAGVLSLFFGVKPFISLYWLWVAPVFFALFMAGVALATIAGILNMEFRDTQQVILILVQVLWFSSPVFFAREIFDTPALKVWADINPVLAFCDVFRDPVLHAMPPDGRDLIAIAVWIGILWSIAIVMLATRGRKAAFYL